ncbi:MAG: GNAT family N-acetyltransferase [Pyrinomonadaceae bacterium]
MAIARFQTADYHDVLRLRGAAFETTATTSFAWRPCQQVESLDRECAKYVYRDKVVKGYAAVYRLDETHFRLNLVVDSRHRRRGIGTLLLGRVEGDVRTSGGKHLQARLREEDAEAGLPFARPRGFREIHRMRGMVLPAADFEYRRWEGLGEKFSAAGYSLTTLKEEAESGSDPLGKLGALQRHAREGWPSPDPTQEGGMATAENLWALFSNIKEPERFVIVKFRDEYVGYTSTEEGPGTAVHPGHRNLGVAKHMKAYAIKLGIDAGWRRFETCSANPAMQRVNEQLGYKFNGLSEVRLVKAL